MDLSKHYTASDIESRWYEHWESRGYFHSEPDDREPFTILIPPPNVTGVLHMGHMLNNTIQDILIRKAKLDGMNTCWVPGTDHASIATEAKVVRMLREKGIKKGDLTREEFLAYAWEWKEKYGGIILDQLRKLGASCDWERTVFTLDEKRSKSVLKVFVDLYNKGKVYRGQRMVNWDPEAQTVLSNEEVLYNDEDSALYYVKYPVVNAAGRFVTIATTRPETILGDTAIAVHPDDERYKDILGKKVLVPLVDREVPVIADTYVDREFGTGALKITPAHDVNDYEIGLRHGLEIVDILNPDGTISEAGQYFVGLDREVARKEMARELKELGFIEQVESYRNSVGRSERTNAVVEPRLSEQWFVDMKALADPALKAVVEDDIQFYPEKYKNIYRHWMENIRDWCISRQLWWGQRIPAYYLEVDGEELVFVAETAEGAVEQAREKTGDKTLQVSDLHQDEDVVDTWFSSWLWPITVFDGFEDDTEFRYYYPTSVLVTGWDIIFLWVARMIMAGFEWKQEKPFRHVYFTGMVRDKLGRKMSKSLGNSPDALELIEQFGADGVRFGILSSSPAGGDLLFDTSLCEQGSKFCNKMWHALRLIKGWDVDKMEGHHATNANKEAADWFEALLHKNIREVNELFAQYRLSEALINLYRLIWDDFCSWYLEMIKPAKGEPIDKETYERTLTFFEHLCTMLHPFMPFITEEIWHQLRDREAGDDCMVSGFPTADAFSEELVMQFSDLRQLVTKVRELRNSKGVAQTKAVSLFADSHDPFRMGSRPAIQHLVAKLANIDTITLDQSEAPDSIPFVVHKEKFHALLPIERNIEEEIGELRKQLEYQKGFVRSVEKKLQNERFVNNAPDDVVARERKKLEDGNAKIQILEESLRTLEVR